MSDQTADQTPDLVQEEEPASKDVTVDDIKTAAIDMRFPSTNQARYCYTRYNEYYKCLKEKGEEAPCAPYKRAFLSLCPNDWVERWEESRANGAWPGKH
jgi:cytochrome c oxidase subunit 6b